jgi:PAS domain S-box-containing protein
MGQDDELLAAILDALGLAVVAASLDGSVLHLNQPAATIFGKSSREAAGLDLGLLVAPECRQKLRDCFRGGELKQPVGPVDYVFLTGDGRRFDAGLSGMERPRRSSRNRDRGDLEAR